MASRSYTTRQKNLKQLDQSTINIIRGINELLVEAQLKNLSTVSSVLEDARESIAWWATHDDYSESNNQALTRQLSVSSGLNIAAILLAKASAVKDEDIRREILELIQSHAT